MSNFNTLIQELTTLFEIDNFKMDLDSSVIFEIAEDTILMEEYKQNILLTVARIVPEFELDISEKALRFCDAHYFPHMVRVGLSKSNELLFTVLLTPQESSASLILKVYEHLKSLHNSL